MSVTPGAERRSESEPPAGFVASDPQLGTPKPPRGIFAFLLRAEEWAFAALILSLLFLGLLPIASRWLPAVSFPPASDLSQQIVLWLALFGAGAATRDRRHIAIDAVGHALTPGARVMLRAVGEFTAALITARLVPLAIEFIAAESARPTSEADALLSIPRIWFLAVLPIGLALLSLRLFIASAGDLRAALLSRKRGGGR